MNSRKSLDLSPQGIKELFSALKKLPNQSPVTAIEVMLGWDYTDDELQFLYKNRYIQYSEYTEAIFTFLTKL
jgi:hypothetical protein